MIMNYLYFVLLLTVVNSDSSKDKPFQVNTTTSFAASAPNYEVTNYYSFDSISSNLLNKEWYVFTIFTLPELNFDEHFYVLFSTISKTTNLESETKVKCKSVG